KVFVAEMVEGEPVTSFFLAKHVQLRQRRKGGSFLSLVLADRSGEVPAVLWEGAEQTAKEVSEGDIVKVQGVLGAYQGEQQLTLSRLRTATPDEVSRDDFLPRSSQDSATLLARLRETVEELQEPHLQRLLRELLADGAFVEALLSAPAAKAIHHAVLGGLLEHTASVTGLCRLLADYYPVVDRDLLLTAAILHDVGKIQELTWDRVFDYTDAGRLLGHITLGTILVEHRIRAIPEFPEPLARRLLHCILSHHGELEWGSPKRPKTLEALVLHYAEDMDGKINSFLSFSHSHPDPQHPGWTQFNKPLDRYLHFGREEGDPPAGTE
ncbi:MAG TPA: HD domain-containing protein, partial [Candidatus Acidoferrum sp.]|nr:HD domain-containing protein [Candidatus Acidoferrum sp.]